MANDLKRLNEALFHELDKLDGLTDPDEIERECERARTISNLASNIVANSNTMLKAVQLSGNVAMAVGVRQALIALPEGEDEL